MTEYIKRNYLRKMAMFEMAYTMETETDAAVVLRMIEDAPAADVAPVAHGRWERRFCHPMRDGEWQYICSVCKNDNYWRNNVCYQKHRYCPNCGAKMDGGAKCGSNEEIMKS